MNYILYGNGGSGNHGCEAIVRGTYELLGGNIRLHSIAVTEDRKYGLDKIADIVSACQKKRCSLSFIYAYLKLKLTGSYIELDMNEYIETIKKANRVSTLALSVGGDNYCYEGTEIYGYLNREYHKRKLKTILWGCSIEPDIVNRKSVAKDLKTYNLIVARESITYEAVKSIGANAILAPDPAFFMTPKSCEMHPQLLDNNVIGINVSPLILEYASDDNIAYKNFLELIKYILKETDAKIALIPHVVWKKNDDRMVLSRLYEDAGRDDRIIMIEDHTAPELKYIISKCRIFVGARTHATIAAYSSLVPTIVVGYSVKARGIAKDLFGTEKNYVIPVQELKEPFTLVETFKRLDKNRDQIQDHLRTIMPEYLKSGAIAKERVLDLL